MEKIIKYGFQPVVHNLIRGQNDDKGKKLFKCNHVYEVVEKTANFKSVITCKVVPQTSVSNVYDVNVLLDKNRNVSNAVCTCKAGLGGKCKHIFALIHYVNSPESSSSKTSQLQQWGKPTQRQLLGYDKGVRMSKLFTPQPLCRETAKLQPVNITVANLPSSLAKTPLAKMLELEEKQNIVVIPSESQLKRIQVKTKQTLIEKAEKVLRDIFLLQSWNKIYSKEVVITQDLYTFYQQYICCDTKTALNLNVLTIQQSNSSEWFQQRTLRITASNGYKLKGHRFNEEKVLTDLLNPKITQNAAMLYGKKNEDVALKEYEQFLDPSWEVVKVGIIINLQQPWLCCSPDAILVHGKEACQKRLVEIKCPYTCRNIPVCDKELGKPNVRYLKRDENGLHLNSNHSIYIQVQLQMYVTNIGCCDLFIYSPQGSVLLNIQRDNQLLAQLIPHLEKFYFTKYIQRLHAKHCSNSK